jgi:putative tRNA adenosine deaminase-associated protein
MSHFAAVLSRIGSEWKAVEVTLDDCESVEDIADLVRDVDGDVRLLVVEQDDEYAVLGRVDEDEIRLFLTDGHAADGYPLAALIAEDLDETGVKAAEDDSEDESEDLDDGAVLDADSDVPITHESAPCGDPGVVEDLGTPASELIALCTHEGTLPIDVIVAVCERAGCAEAFETVRA